MKYILLLFLVSFEAFAGVVSVRQFDLAQQISVSVASSASKQVVGKNPNRGYLIIQNLDAAALLYLTVKSAAVSNESIVIPANNGSYEFLVAPTDAVYLKSSVNNSSAAILEGNTK